MLAYFSAFIANDLLDMNMEINPYFFIIEKTLSTREINCKIEIREKNQRYFSSVY